MKRVLSDFNLIASRSGKGHGRVCFSYADNRFIIDAVNDRVDAFYHIVSKHSVNILENLTRRMFMTRSFDKLINATDSVIYEKYRGQTFSAVESLNTSISYELLKSKSGMPYIDVAFSPSSSETIIIKLDEVGVDKGNKIKNVICEQGASYADAEPLFSMDFDSQNIARLESIVKRLGTLRTKIGKYGYIEKVSRQRYFLLRSDTDPKTMNKSLVAFMASYDDCNTFTFSGRRPLCSVDTGNHSISLGLPIEFLTSLLKAKEYKPKLIFFGDECIDSVGIVYETEYSNVMAVYKDSSWISTLIPYKEGKFSDKQLLEKFYQENLLSRRPQH